MFFRVYIIFGIVISSLTVAFDLTSSVVVGKKEAGANGLSSQTRLLNRVTVRFDENDVELGPDNRFVLIGSIDVVDDQNQVRSLTVVVRATDRGVRYKKTLVGYVSEMTNVLQGTVSTPLDPTIHAFQTSAVDAGIGSTSRRLLQNNNVNDPICEPGDSLCSALSNAIGGCDEVDQYTGEAVCKFSDEVNAALRSAADATNRDTEKKIADAESTLDGFSGSLARQEELIAELSGRVAGLVNRVNDEATALLFNQTVSDLLDEMETTNTNIVLDAIERQKEFDRVKLATAEFSSDLDAKLASTANLFSFSQDVEVQQTAVDGLVEVLQTHLGSSGRRLSQVYERLRINLKLARTLIARVYETRRDSSVRRQQVEIISVLQSIVSSFGLRPFTSACDSGIAPSGQIPLNLEMDSSGLSVGVLSLTEKLPFARTTIVYSTTVPPTMLADDPDVLSLDESSAQTAAWDDQIQSTFGTDNPPPTYLNFRGVSMFCNNDYLLSERSEWFSFEDIMSLLGPPQCQPGLSVEDGGCRCWAVIERYRCLARTDFLSPARQTVYQEEAIRTKSEFSTYCYTSATSTDGGLDAWFAPDTSINALSASPTRRQQTTVVLDYDEVGLALEEACTAPVASGDNFHVASIIIGPGQAGSFDPILVPHDPNRCGRSARQIKIDSIQSEQATLNYIFLDGVNRAVTELFQRVNLHWEVAKYGALPSDVLQETLPFHHVDDVPGRRRQPLTADEFRTGVFPPDRPPTASRRTTTSFIATSRRRIPVYHLQRAGVDQDITVEIIDDAIANDPSTPSTGVVRVLTQNELALVSSSVVDVPESLFVAGFMDCWLQPCPSPLSVNLPPSFRDFDEDPLPVAGELSVYDISHDDISLSRGGQTRCHKANYLMQFKMDQGLVTPEGHPQDPEPLASIVTDTPPVFGSDQWRLQEGDSTSPDPRCATDSLLYYRRRLTELDHVCNQTDVDRAGMGLGSLCQLLLTHRPRPQFPLRPVFDPNTGTYDPSSPLPFPGSSGLDQSSVVWFYPRRWTLEASIDLPAGDFVVQAGPETSLVCPDYSQVRLSIPSRGAAYLNWVNQLDQVMTVRLDTSGELDECSSTLTRLAGPGSRQSIALPYCNSMSLSLWREEGEVSRRCWSWSGNLTESWLRQRVNQPSIRQTDGTPGSDEALSDLPTHNGLSLAQTLGSTAEESLSQLFQESNYVALGTMVVHTHSIIQESYASLRSMVDLKRQTEAPGADVAALRLSLAEEFANLQGRLSLFQEKLATVAGQSADAVRDANVVVEEGSYEDFAAELRQLLVQQQEANDILRQRLSSIEQENFVITTQQQENLNALEEMLTDLKLMSTTITSVNEADLPPLSTFLNEDSVRRTAGPVAWVKTMSFYDQVVGTLEDIGEAFVDAAEAIAEAGEFIIGLIQEALDCTDSMLSSVGIDVIPSEVAGGDGECELLDDLWDTLKTIFFIVIGVILVVVAIKLWLAWRQSKQRNRSS